MNKYRVLYCIINDDNMNGVNLTHLTLNYALNESTIKRTEIRLKKVLGVRKVIILQYSKLGGK